MEGATATIDYALYVRISERATVLLDSDLSKGFDLRNEIYSTNIGNGVRGTTSISLGINANDVENRCR